MAKTAVLFTVLSALILTGCSTPPPPPPLNLPPTLLMEFQMQAGHVLDAGGIAAVGVGESQALNIALNRAKAHGRRELARALETRIGVLRADLSLETGRLLRGKLDLSLKEVAEAIIETHIQRCTATQLRYETVDDTVIAYTLMELNPNVITEEIAKKQTVEEHLKQTKARQRLYRDIETYEAYKVPLADQD